MHGVGVGSGVGVGAGVGEGVATATGAGVGTIVLVGVLPPQATATSVIATEGIHRICFISFRAPSLWRPSRASAKRGS